MDGSQNISPIEAPVFDPGAPLILVGTARSGSSLLTLMLNRGAGGFIVNDAYPAQIAEALGLGVGPETPEKLALFRSACLARLRERSVEAPPAPIHRSLVVGPTARARAMEAAGADWPSLWADILRRASRESGLWGWNTPPDFARAEELLAAYPRARFVFLMRDPYAVLRSYRNLPAYWGREARRYHPALQAFAWRRAAEAFGRLAARRPDRVALVRYEQLVADPEGTLRRLGDHLGVPTRPVDPGGIAGNGSAPGGALTAAEVAVANLALGAAAAAFGYRPPDAAPGGGRELFRLTLRAGAYYAGEAARSRDMRGRIRRLIRA